MVLTAGSTGDVEPFAALAARLAGRGHAVTMAADAGFERLTQGDGVRFAPISADFRSLQPTRERKRPSRDDVFGVMRGMLDDSWNVANSCRPQLIVAHQKTLAAPHIAEKLDVPHVRALTVPMLTPTREFPVPALVRHDLGGVLNRASYRLVDQLTRPYAGLIRNWRRDDLRLAPKGVPPAPARTLYCYSPSLVPTPSDWPPDAMATGYWLREDGGSEDAVDPGLESFVAADAPPVYIGFGSSVGRDSTGLGSTVAAAVREADVRAVIATGWGGMSDIKSSAEAIVVERAPHGWLFPRVAAVVHHGGAGTTAAGLLAARPTVVCPFQGDQHFWGAAVHRAGAGPKPLPAKKLSSGGLASAIRTAMEDSGMRNRASELSERIRSERGTDQAAEQIHAVLAEAAG